MKVLPAPRMLSDQVSCSSSEQDPRTSSLPKLSVENTPLALPCWQLAGWPSQGGPYALGILWQGLTSIYHHASL